MNPTLCDALLFSAKAHCAAGQTRKGTSFPYAVHPIRVGETLHLYGADDEVVTAGFLHDVIEDAAITREEIEERFGPRVAAIVVGASEPDKTASWKDRKQHTIDYIRDEADRDTLLVAAADKLDNVRSIRETLRLDGEAKTWARFKEGRTEQHWYYRALATAFLSRDPDSALFRTLDYETQELFPDQARRTPFFAGKPIATAHDARAYLADPIRHWKPAYSAYELAHAWVGNDGLPSEVAGVLGPVYGECEIVEGFFEKETPLASRGRASQTDLLLLLRATGGHAVVGVEGKAREPFGKLVADWNDGSEGKVARLAELCERLGLEPDGVGGLRYQLFHRTAACLIEAERYGASQAVMLVHSFDPGDASLEDYGAFAEALGLTGAEVGRLTSEQVFGGITLRLGWAKARHG